MIVKIVLYKGEYFVWYKTNDSGFACLLDENGNKFSGTPSPSKLEAVKELECK
jgi:hypothetical protein